MIRTLNICVGLLLLIAQIGSAARRHEIYWNPKSSPRLLLQNDYVVHVKIGEFMDIICPQRSLLGITSRLEHLVPFTIFNVSKENYENCRHEGHKDFMFACNRPERENKLTIKFQTISPSPLGFRFQYCADYYFVAIPQRGQHSNPVCQKNTTRLRISVKCKEHKRPRKTTTSTTSTSATTTEATVITSTQIDPKTTSLPQHLVSTAKTKPDKKIVEPEIKHVRRHNNGTSEHRIGLGQQTKESDDGRNASSHHTAPRFIILTVSMFVVWISSLSLSEADFSTFR